MRPTCLLAGCIMTLLTLPILASGVDADDAGKAGRQEGVARESDAVVRQILREAINAVTAPRKAEDDAGRFTPPDLDVEQSTVKALLAIGKAQAAVGDREAASKTWQDANDRISALTTFDSGQTKAGLLQSLADVQIESGEKDEALATLQQASQAARVIRLGRVPPHRVLFGGDVQVDQAAAFRSVAAAQARAGDARAAGRTFRQAIEAADAIKDDNARVNALVEVAKADAPGGRATWTRATDLALSLKDEFRKSKAIETALRGLVESGGEKDALGLVADRLDGDLRAYGIWVVADALAGREGAVPPDVIGRLAGLAEQARFDLPSKSMKVLTQVAMIQAKARDDDGAYKTIGKFVPQNAQQMWDMVLVKFAIMKEVAQTLIRAGKKEEAQGTLQAALEALAPFADNDGGVVEYADEISRLMVKAGAPDAAIRIAGEIRDAGRRTNVLVEIASAQAESGERGAALKTLESARSAIDGIANDILWSGIDPRRRESSGRAKAMFPFGLSFDLNLKHQAMGNLAVGMAKAGDVAHALEIARPLSVDEDPTTRNHGALAIDGIAQAQTKRGDFAGAVKTADHIRDTDSFNGDEKIALLKKIAEAQAKSGDAKGVLAWGTARGVPKAKLAVLQAMAEGIVAKKSPKKDEDAAAANSP